MIVARLIQFGKLGGFHFNDSKYGDDDLDAGSINPYRLFLVFNELVDAELSGADGFDPAHMLDQSPQRHRPDREPDDVRASKCSAPMRRRCSSTARRSTRYQDANDALMATRDAEGGLPHRCRADPGHGAAARRRRDRSGRGLSRQPATAARSRPSARPSPAVAAASSDVGARFRGIHYAGCGSIEPSGGLCVRHPISPHSGRTQAPRSL